MMNDFLISLLYTSLLLKNSWFDTENEACEIVEKFTALVAEYLEE